MSVDGVWSVSGPRTVDGTTVWFLCFTSGAQTVEVVHLDDEAGAAAAVKVLNDPDAPSGALRQVLATLG